MPDARPALNGDTQLTTLPLTERQREVVLDEVFLVPPRALFPEAVSPGTVGELAVAAGLSVAETVLRLGRIVEMSRGIEVIPRPEPSGTIRLIAGERWDWDELPAWRTAPLVIVAGEAGRAFSAAMFLRQHGVTAFVG